MSQLSYSTLPAPFAGMRVDMMRDDIRSLVNTDVLNVPFGVAVAQGNIGTNGDNAAVLPSGSTFKFLGAVAHSHTYDNGPNGLLTPTGLKPTAVLDVLSQGRIWVLVEEAVNAEDPAFVRFVAGPGGTQLGAWRKSADTASAGAVKARYRTSAGAGGFAQVEILSVDQ